MKMKTKGKKSKFMPKAQPDSLLREQEWQDKLVRADSLRRDAAHKIAIARMRRKKGSGAVPK
jgi:hypothetical protein